MTELTAMRERPRTAMRAPIAFRLRDSGLHPFAHTDLLGGRAANMA